MRSLRLLLVAPVLLLQGCWFVFIPGSVTAAITDGLTGATGEHCVSTTAKVGDRYVTQNGTLEIVSLSGTSSRCQDQFRPIRAKLTAIPS